MTEYITKQTALDAIEARAQEEVASANHYYLMGFQDAAEAVSESQALRWIPVTEALPETDDFVLISVNGDYNHQHFLHAIMIGDYIEDDGWMIHEYPEIEAVTANHLVEAWMPLPEMYGGVVE